MDSVTSVLVAVFCIVIAMLLNKVRVRNKKFLDGVKGMAGPEYYPLVGTIKYIGTSSDRVIATSKEMQAEYGDVFRMPLPFFGAVIMARAEHLEIALSNTEEIKKAEGYRFLQPWLGTGLLTATGAKWHAHRKMFTPTFHFKILESFLDIFYDKSEILVKKLLEITPGKEFDMYRHITLCTLDIICETAMGINMNTQLGNQDNSENAEYINSIYILSEIISTRVFRPWLFIDKIFYSTSAGKRSLKVLESLHGFTNKVVKEKIAARKQNKGSKNEKTDEDDLGIKKKQAFLDLLLEASEESNALTEAEIREEVDTFMFEGHDTTTAGICWCLLLLGNHPEIQDKVAAELQDIFKGEKRRITMSDLKEMKYMEMVLKESLRLYPSVPFISRRLKNDLKIDNYTITAGSEVRFSIFNVHRNPKYYSNPNEFNPDNFLPEVIKQRHPYAFIPFSAGPRNCIGQKFAMLEEKTILTSILLNFRIESQEKMEDIIPLAELILRPKSGMRVKLYPRSQK